ncbi:hypothetical protein [Persephonella sp. KM09-Lau-8]|uniref:hypothetical protein n=1 Tax=Persephonella sp. KM09-Lau-8 TaxID=1158345 RepID=UPI0004972B74|nr:hypothetical protein [Persephonella sp. KM09-Lau-8]
MAKIIVEIDKEGTVNVEGVGFEGNSCEKSKTLNKILNYLKQEGEIDQITRKYQEKQKNTQTIEIKDLI